MLLCGLRIVRSSGRLGHESGGEKNSSSSSQWCRSHSILCTVSVFFHSCVRKVLVVQKEDSNVCCLDSFPCYSVIFHSHCTFLNWEICEIALIIGGGENGCHDGGLYSWNLQ